MLAIQRLLIRDQIASISVTKTFTFSHEEQVKRKKKILFVSKTKKEKRGGGESHVSISGGQETYTAAHLEEIRGNDSVCK